MPDAGEQKTESQPAPPEEATPSEPAAPARRFTDTAGPPATVLGPTMRLDGEISGEDSVAIHGRVKGSITSEGLCRIAAGAEFHGTLHARLAILEGRVDGRVHSRGKTELGAEAQVTAEIEARTVAMADGCVFDGAIHMHRSDDGNTPGGAQTFTEKRQRQE